MADWTRDRVEGRLIEAADVLRRLPDERLQGFVSSWPTMFHRFADLVGQAPPTQKPAAPAPDAISRMEATLPWLTWLQSDEAKLVWARAEGAPWKAICRRFGITRATAHRRWEYGLSVITWRLNGQRVPAKRSRRFLVDRVKSLSSPI